MDINAGTTAPTTTTATILFTDVVSSTAIRVRLGEAAADALFVDHQRRLGQVVARRGGRVVKTAGDGVMAAFGSASEAVRAAVDLQQHVSSAPADLQIRVGLAAGDVAWQDDDCFGLPVVAASRLQATAGGGEIVASGVVRQLAADRTGVVFEALGPLELKGFDEPVEAYAVRWEPDRDRAADAGATTAPPLPLALAVRDAHPLVGRADAMASIRDTWASAQRGPGRIVLLGGEAGAGKTRLASEFAAEVHEAGGCVVHGGCELDLGLPYQPWVQGADQLLPVLRASLSAEQQAALAPLAHLAPQAGWMVDAARQVSLDAGAERYRTYAAFVALLSAAAERWPTVVVLDDLHWAGTQTLALLRHVGRAGLPRGVLVVGTFRDTGDEITEPLASCLADLRRVAGAARMRLGALDANAVEHFVADAVSGPLDLGMRRLAVWLAQRSGGNPYYLGELWRHFLETGVVTYDGRRWRTGRVDSPHDVPDSVREVVADRLSRLSEATRRIVDIAALAGQRIDLQVVSAASDLGPESLDDALGELIEAGLLVEVSGTALVYRFAHAIVRDTAVTAIAPRARAQLHRRLAEAIEANHQADRRPVLAQLAHHFAAAGAPVGKVAYYGLRAGTQAIRAAAYDEAVAHFDRVLGIDPPARDRGAVLVQLGTALLRQGAYQASADACAEAFDLAVELDDARLATDAAVGFETAMAFPGLTSPHALSMLRTALDMLDDESTAAYATAKASLGRALAFSGDPDGVATAEEAVVLARSVGGDSVLAVALQAMAMALYTSGTAERRVALGAELEQVSLRIGDGFSTAYAYANSLVGLFALGHLDEARNVLARHRAVSSAGHFATFEFLADAFDMQLALAAGDLAGAEAAAERARERGSATSSPYDAGVYGLQMYAIRRAQGRLAEVAPLMRAVASSPDAPPMWRPGLAALFAELGMVDDARSVFEQLAPDGFAAVARDAVWPASVLFLAETCWALGDLERAAMLYQELGTFSGQNLQVGMTVCFGPADRLLGDLAGLLANHEVADEHFAAALALAERSGSPLWGAETQYDWARTLTSRDPKRAEQLAAAAMTTARSFGIGRLADRPLATSASNGAPARVDAAVARLPDDLSTREADVLRLLATGLSNRRIGGELFISQHTVANHVRSILRKTGCANRTEASLYAVRHGLADNAT